MMLRQLALLAGGTFIAALGVALISVPAALVLFGCSVVVFALFWDQQ